MRPARRGSAVGSALRRLGGLLAAALLGIGNASSASAVDDGLPPRLLDTVVVSGEQPGPGLWQVIAPDGHRMWVLGTLAPLPKRMEWTATEVEQKVAGAGRVLLPPQVDFDVEAGLFGRLALLPAALRARNNPDGVRLADIVPAALYARWRVQKQRYLPRNRGIEKRRPIVAAQQLFDAALDQHDLAWKNAPVERVRRVARRHRVELSVPTLRVPIKDPKALLRDWNARSLDDLDCFAGTLERLERDIEPMKLRANAWALGEIGYLRQADYTRSYRACIDALLDSRTAREHGLDDIEPRLRETWMGVAEDTLARHASSIALLPMSLVIRPDGYLAELGRRGYRIIAPDEPVEAETGSPPATRADTEAGADDVAVETAPRNDTD